MLTEDEFVAKYSGYSLDIAARHGFAVPRREGTPVPTAHRIGIVDNRTTRALAVLEDLQQWLSDDEEEVRNAARAGIQRCLFLTYTGDRSEINYRKNRIAATPVRLLRRLITNHTKPDTREPKWIRGRRARAICWVSSTLATLLAAYAGGLIILGEPLIALGVLLASVAIDVFDYSFADAIGIKSANTRWASCILGKLSDLLILGSIVWSLNDSPYTGYVACLAIAMSATLFGSFVRVSALQAGYRLWRSAYERIVRFLAVVSYLGLVYAGQTEAGLILLAAALVLFGLYEAVRVPIRVVQVSQHHQRGIVVVGAEGPMTCAPREEPIRLPNCGEVIEAGRQT